MWYTFCMTHFSVSPNTPEHADSQEARDFAAFSDALQDWLTSHAQVTNDEVLMHGDTEVIIGLTFGSSPVSLTANITPKE